MLTELDRTKSINNLIMLCTSNFADSIDEAFKSRVDIHYQIPCLSMAAIYKILIDMLTELQKIGVLGHEPVLLPGFKAAALEKTNGLMELCTLLFKQQINGRKLRRLPFKLLSSFAMVQCPS